MSRAVYALLVGIDGYQAPVSPLKGCINDITRVERLLQERIVGENEHFDSLVMVDAAATRQGIIQAFRSHLSQAKRDDVAVFYFSGHGSQAPSPREFWHLEPDRLDETLVCYDSRSPGGWDLADKELALLISELAVNDPHIVVILDCCHSGSGTRALEDGVGIRRVPTDNRQRPIDTFIVTPSQATRFDQSAAGAASETPSGWFTLPHGRHIVLSACRADETAKELNLGGEQRGAFSYFLLDTLQRTSASLTYRDLFKRVHALVRARVSRQSPQLEATSSEDLHQPFLGGAIQPTNPYFTVSYDKTRGWVIDGGGVHGIPPVVGGESTILALFDFDASLQHLRDLESAIGDAQVTSIFPSQSAVEVTLYDGSRPDPEGTYKAVVTALPLPPLLVSLEGETGALDLVRATMATAGPEGGPSLLVREAERNQAELRLLAQGDGYRIRRVADAYPLVVDVPGFTPASAYQTVERLEHMARWFKIAELTNQTSRLGPNAVQMEVTQIAADGSEEPVDPTAGLQLAYHRQEDSWREPEFRLKLKNNSDRRLYCMLLDLTEAYSVWPGLLPGGGVWLAAGEETWAFSGELIPASVPDHLWDQGVVEYKDWIKLIFSTEESDATLLAQEELDVALARAVDRVSQGRVGMSTLNRLMQRVQTRDIGRRSSQSEALADWNTNEISVTTVRPLEATPIPAKGETIPLGSGVTVLGHRRLHASARLSTLSQASRDVGNLFLPALLRDYPEAVEPLEFSTSRGGEPGLSVLELMDVADHTVVTAEEPLTVQLQATLDRDEFLLPLGYDGEFFLPLGRSRRHEAGLEISLERLPAPTSRGERDLKGSIRILFQKVIGQQIGLEFKYPVLAMAEVSNDGSVTYTAELATLQEKVDQAERILLYVHGMFGDSRGMAGSARAPRNDQELALGESYDLILTFDYESIHTTVEETARALKQRLHAAGLGAGHGKTLHVIGHSLGGLVSRWFVEREEGHQLVQHLVTAGSPHKGSPWPTVQAWATTALTIGLNSLSVVAWPVKALGSLINVLEWADVTLDQVSPSSEFLKSLNNSTDPGIPYTVLAGNTSIIPAALEREQEQKDSKLERLLSKIQPRKMLYNVTAAAFLGQPNDIAVGVHSATGVPSDRLPAPYVLEVASDHISYFSSEAGLQALAKSLK